MNISENHEEAVRKLFTETSLNYAGLFLPRKTGKNFIFGQRLTLAIEAVLKTSGKIFDCATGSGEIVANIISTGKFEHATILDISPEMLDLASKQIKDKATTQCTTNIELKCEDVFHFARENSHRQYDCVLCLGLIAHTGRLQELLVLLRGMLAPNGIILLQSTLLDHLGTKMERAFSKRRYYRKHGYRISYFCHEDIKAACAGAKLEIVERKRYALGIPFGDRFWGWGNYQLERIFQGFANTRGSEAIYVLKANAPA